MINVRPTIGNVSITDADTEYSYALPDFTKKFIIKLRGLGAPFKIAFVSGDSGSTYVNVSNAGSYQEKNIKSKGSTLYFQSPSANQIAEIISYV